MNAATTLTARVEQYLTERRRLGFELEHMGYALHELARHVLSVKHRGALTVELMAAWARQAHQGPCDQATYARRLKILRPFTRWLQQFEPATEVPDDAIFGPTPRRVTPHIYRDEEIVALLDAAGRIGPPLSPRAAVMQTLLGLLACTGMRIGEALALVDNDVDLETRVATIRKAKFAKSRVVILHPSAVDALRCYLAVRNRFVSATPQTPLFIACRGRLLGQPFGDHQVHRIFDQLRRQLGWVGRGAHAVPRIHDLRHTFAVRCVLRWHEQGVDVHQRMLGLSTYLGHAKISNTYWYLTGVPELMTVVGKRFEQFVDPWEDNGGEDGDE